MNVLQREGHFCLPKTIRLGWYHAGNDDILMVSIPLSGSTKSYCSYRATTKLSGRMKQQWNEANSPDLQGNQGNYLVARSCPVDMWHSQIQKNAYCRLGARFCATIGKRWCDEEAPGCHTSDKGLCGMDGFNLHRNRTEIRPA